MGGSNTTRRTDPIPDGIPVITGPSRRALNDRQLTDYRTHRETLLTWLATAGKNPETAEGYSQSPLKNTAYRLDQFYRWVWDHEGYTVEITHDHGDAYLEWLADEVVSEANKKKVRMALKRLFKWHHHERGADPWEPELSFSGGHDVSQPWDYLTREERRNIREAAMEYGSIPGYNDLTPEERSRWKRYLAQRFEKPVSEVHPSDWDRANSWKIPSLVWTSLDAGLRPIEVERAVTYWVDTQNGILRIPKEESSKNRGNWIVGLTDRTAEALNRWLAERETYPKYDSTETLWLTREGNPYQSYSLKYLLERLCEIADINTESRKMSWYALRHSTGTYMTREEDLAATQQQLRHKRPETTMKYDQTPVEDRKNALERM